jgi:hypothetical protein
MNRCKQHARISLAFALLLWGCHLAESAIVEPKPLASAKELTAGDESKKLDADVIEFVRGRYTIVSARYYRIGADVPWVAISKNVQNQMAEKSIKRVMLDWYEPGIDFVETYPQGQEGAAVAVAMPKGAKSSAEKIVGYYVLGPGAKK